MSGNSSSDEEWCVPPQRPVYNVYPETNCWECGKHFRSLTNLISHYKTHNTAATCYICNVVFRRLTSLSTHLENAHSPPLCKQCFKCFSGVWELNKHAETECLRSESFQEASPSISADVHQRQKSNVSSDEVTSLPKTISSQRTSVPEMRPQQRTETNSKTPESLENSVDYILDEDDEDFDSDCEKTDESESSESENDANVCSTMYQDDPETDDDSSSTDCSSDTFDSLDPIKTPAALPNAKSLLCTVCGRGPYKSLKLHLLHCSGVRVKYKCSLCKKLFPTETALNEHYMPLYSCGICGQVFSHENLYNHHQCPKEGKSPLVYFCSETMPKVCNICKLFFTCEKTLLNHVTRAHTSVVSTKVCIITNPSGLTNTSVSEMSRPLVSNQHLVRQVLNGKVHVGQTYAGSPSTNVKSCPSFLLASSSHPGSPPAATCESSLAILNTQNNHVLQQTTNQPLKDSVSGCTGEANTIPANVPPEQVSPHMPTIMAMFKNDSHEVALMKRMNTGWRFKAPYSCRQCGAIFRQPSPIISHRYLHRGHRPHRCQCGRAFKHRLHLLRHCVQHAEATSYICVSCGETFTGARLLAKHIQGKSHSGSKWKHKVKTKCKVPFTCDCGRLFFRPSAYIWHQLNNWEKPKPGK